MSIENFAIYYTVASTPAEAKIIHMCCISLLSLVCLRCKMPIFQRVGRREGGGPLPLGCQYLILMTWRPWDLNLVVISSLASKCQHFKHGGFQFHYIKWLKNGHSNFQLLAFWSQWRYHDQIQITRSSYHKNQILSSSLLHSHPLEYRHFTL